MMKVYVVILDDRHCDTDIDLFTDKDYAIEFARQTAINFTTHPWDDEEDCGEQELEEDSPFLYYCVYSTEGDNVTVVERELDDPKNME